MAKPKDPKPLYAVVCDNGEVYVDEEDLMYVGHTWDAAYTYLDMVASAGWKCPCKDHRIVAYGPKEKK